MRAHLPEQRLVIEPNEVVKFNTCSSQIRNNSGELHANHCTEMGANKMLLVAACLLNFDAYSAGYFSSSCCEFIIRRRLFEYTRTMMVIMILWDFMLHFFPSWMQRGFPIKYSLKLRCP